MPLTLDTMMPLTLTLDTLPRASSAQASDPTLTLDTWLLNAHAGRLPSTLTLDTPTPGFL